MWWFKGEEQVKKEKEEKGRSIIMHSFVLFNTYIYIYKFASSDFIAGDKDIIFDIFRFLRKWNHKKKYRK
jgi:hypothetical protein